MIDKVNINLSDGEDKIQRIHDMFSFIKLAFDHSKHSYTVKINDPN